MVGPLVRLRESEDTPNVPRMWSRKHFVRNAIFAFGDERTRDHPVCRVRLAVRLPARSVEEPESAGKRAVR